MKNLIATATLALGLSVGLPGAPAMADEPFIGEISWFAGNFAPRGWAFCDGQLLSIAQNTALFSIIGTIYGGDGRSTMALPNMQGRAPLHAGNGPGLTPRRQGERGGTTTTTMTVQNLPNHTHTAEAKASGAAADSAAPAGLPLGGATAYASRGTPDTNMNGGTVAIGTTGGQQAANNLQPSIAVNCIIALQGLYPSRS